jgi:endonuclease YncB( thermonuclease family)
MALLRFARLSAALVSFAFVCAISIASAAELTGRVVAIADGDTFTLLTNAKEQVRVRLTEIDAPESGQPWGQRAKQDLSALIFSQPVRVIYTGKDQYGRTLGRVHVGDKDVNGEMVRIGSAWAYRQYLTDTSFLRIEEGARAAKRGLWSLAAEQIVPPWEWRSSGRASAAASTVAPSQSGQQCGAKRVCRQMSSCAEARFYLNVCGVRSLDGDHDGIPCENLCR